MKLSFIVVILAVFFAIGLLMMAHFFVSFIYTPNVSEIFNEEYFSYKRITSLFKLHWFNF